MFEGGGGDILIMEALPTSEPEGVCGGLGVGAYSHLHAMGYHHVLVK